MSEENSYSFENEFTLQVQEKILSLQDEKKNMINKIIGKDSLDESINLTTLSEEELLALFCR